MNSLFKKLIISSFLLVSGISNAGFASMGVLGGLGLFAPKIADTTGTAGYAPVFGVRLDVGAGPIGIMADVMYATRKLEIPVIGEVKYNYLTVPVQARLSLGFTKLTGGLYYAKGLGNVSTTLADVTTTQTFSENGKKSSDFGAILGFGFSVPLGVASLLAEIRYLHGLQDVSTSAVAWNNRSVEMLAGVMF